jgi:4-amino-4-deoxy-L-arabinose transferase-like glycosyltransferase
VSAAVDAAAARPAAAPASPRARRLGWLALAIVLGLTAVRIGAVALTPLNLFADEARYWVWSQTLAWGYATKPPLIAWLIAAMSGVCGSSELCLRLPSAVLHAASAGVLYLLARRLYGPAAGAWAALTFATVPAVSLSSILISTDVPLIFFWSIALLALNRTFETRRLDWAAATGAAIGLGLLSKYAMAYFILCTLLYCALTPARRWFLASRPGGVALAVALLVVGPNLWWNARNAFATFRHTGTNAGWTADWFHPLKMLEFAASQLGVFGPILLVVLIIGLLNGRRSVQRAADRYLLFFSLPVLLVILVQALISRAYANWAAAAYPAATVLVVAWLLRWGPRVLPVSLGLHAGVAAAGYVFVAFVAGLPLPRWADPTHRVLGWDRVADAVARRAAGASLTGILVPDHNVLPELLYYLRDDPRAAGLPVVMWPGPPVEPNEYEQSRPIDAQTGARALVVTVEDTPAPFAGRFRRMGSIESTDVPVRSDRSRMVGFAVAEGYRPPLSDGGGILTGN